MELRWLDGPLWPSNDSEGGGTRQLAGECPVGDEEGHSPSWMGQICAKQRACKRGSFLSIFVISKKSWPVRENPMVRDPGMMGPGRARKTIFSFLRRWETSGKTKETRVASRR